MRLLKIGNLDAESRQMENFGYWHDRLVILKEVYDEARPSTLSQWWYDRRNGVQWYTFWVALLVLILTIMFGLIQCIEGAIQAYVALKQWQPSIPDPAIKFRMRSFRCICLAICLEHQSFWLPTCYTGRPRLRGPAVCQDQMEVLPLKEVYSNAKRKLSNTE